MQKLLLIVVGVVLVGCGKKEDNTEVKIDDPLLNELLAEKFGKPSGELAPEAIFTKSELSRVTDLNGDYDFDGFTDATIREVTEKLPNLSSLAFGNKVTDAVLGDVAGLTNLKSLRLGEQITNEGLKEVAKMQQLRELNLNSKITDEGLKIVSKMDHLTSLSLGYGERNYSKEGFKEIFKMHNIVILDLRHSPVEDSMLIDIVKMRGLKNGGELTIGRNQITKKGYENLWKAMPNCKIIY